jgi:hypothetical protein
MLSKEDCMLLKEDCMLSNDAISEFIGDIANCAVAKGGVKITLKKLAEILTKKKIESHLWEYYRSRTDGLIRKAYAYFLGKGDTKSADIKRTFIKANGAPLIS